MVNSLIFGALVPMPAPVTLLGQVLSSLGFQRTINQQANIVVPSEGNETHGYFRPKCVRFGVELVEVQPGTVLPSESLVLVIMYNVPYEIVLGNKKMRKTAEGCYEVCTKLHQAILTVERGFSAAAMSELLNRWECARSLGGVSEGRFAHPSIRAFNGYKASPARDGITFVIRDRFSAP